MENYNLKFKIILTVSVSILVYFFVTDFSLIKKLIGYNALEFEEPEIVVSGEDSELPFLNILEGFKISVAASGLENPRVILFDLKERMLVSETKAGRVSVLTDDDGDGVFESKNTLIGNLKLPHGLDFYPEPSRQGGSYGAGKDPKTGVIYLYIAETHQVARYRYDIDAGKLVDAVGEHVTKLPDDSGHFTRTIAFGPNYRTGQIVSGVGGINTQVDAKLYISVGSSCDVCEENTWKRAAILESDPEGSYTAEFAGGLRNAVFFVFHPVTKEIWATEMGRDNLGDDLPPDEINIVKVAGPEHKFGARRYGWPFCYGDKIRDRKFNPDKFDPEPSPSASYGAGRIDIPADCAETEPPIIEIQAHSAPLGLVFVPAGIGWPKGWEGDLLVAYHGSWNRTEPTGYKIVRYDLDGNGKVLFQEPIDFISGWLSNDKKDIYGRPVDLKFDLDGALYISDDAGGVVYKVETKNEK